MTPRNRVRVLLAVSWLCLGGLASRLFALQVARHEEYAARAEKRRRRVDWQAPRRGKILDREGRVLAVDRPAADVVVELLELDPALEMIRPLANATRYPSPESLEAAAVARGEVPGQPARAVSLHEKSPHERAKDLTRVFAWIADRFADARAKVRAGAKAAVVAHAPDAASRARVEKLAKRFPGLVTAPDPAGGFQVIAPASLLEVRDQALAELARAADLDVEELRAVVQAHEDDARAIQRSDRRHEALQKPIVVAKDVTFDVVARVEETSVAVPGIGVRRRYERHYPRGPLAAHFLGYLTPLAANELEAERRAGNLVDETADAAGLLLGDVRQIPGNARLREEPRGRTGLEARLDAELAGLPGARVVERDAGDRSRLVLLDLPPRDGEDVTTTLDAEIQDAAERALDEAVQKHGEADAGGAAVLLSVETGDVLALASAPRFDPNVLGKTFAALDQDPRKPLLHRAGAPVPPGSTFKILSAFAFFGEGGISLGDRFPCRHALIPGKKGFHCDANHGEAVDLETALAESCNVFFFRAADKLGPEPLTDWAARAGFGQAVSTWFPLGKGRFPDRRWKVRRLEDSERSLEAHELALSQAASDLMRDWKPERLLAVERAREGLLHARAWRERFSKDLGYGPGDLRNAAIGQGDVRATPVQVARLAALVAGKGRAAQARLLSTDEPAFETLALDPRVLETVEKGLEGCCTHGTAHDASVGLARLDVAGKTGTAERGSGKPNYAWFTGYYPASRPEVAFACLVDTTKGHGGTVCGPIARKLVEAYARSKGEEPKRR